MVLFIRVALAILTLTLAVPSRALFDPGNVGLPTRPPVFDPTDPGVIEPPLPEPPFPPTPPPLAIEGVGLQWIELQVRVPGDRTAAELFKMPPFGEWAPFGSVEPGTDTLIRDEGLEIGQGYCYRIELSGGTRLAESHTRCATTLGAAPPVDQSAPECPETRYLGNHPSGHLRWTETLNGLAHDDGHWFIAQQKRIWKIPAELELGGVAFSLAYNGPLPGIVTTDIPRTLRDEGYNHFGDLEHVAGYLLVPLEGGPPAIGVFRASDLAYLGKKLIAERQDRAPWVAYNPINGLLYTSSDSVLDFLHRFRLDLDALAAGDFESAIVFHDYFWLHEADERYLLRPGFGQYIQGGAFTPWGDLYLVNGKTKLEPEDGRGGIHVIDPLGRTVSESASGSGDFDYEYHPGFPDYEEPEGIDWWDLDARPDVPGPGGQLHALLLENALGTDGVYLKHYRASYDCAAGRDTDRDGLQDRAEIDVHGSDPGVADTDGDGLSDGAEVLETGTSPTDRDSDGDGVSDADEVRGFVDPQILVDDGGGWSWTAVRYLASVGVADPAADTDADGVLDVEEIHAAGTDPLAADSDADGLPDDVEAPYGTGLTADADLDGLPDERDVDLLRSALQRLALPAFRRGGAEKAHRRLDRIEALLLAGDSRRALAALARLGRRIDGCGDAPDRNDWVLACDAQVALRSLADALAAGLEAD